MKNLIFITLVLIASASNAGGWTHYDSKHGSITSIEIVRAQGFLIYGELGDAAKCGTEDFLWVPAEHPQYDKLYSTALAAYMAGKKIQAYAHECKEIGWHGGSFSTVNGAGAMYIKN